MPITVELKEGFQAYVNTVPIQDTPINTFVDMKNCHIFNGRLRKRIQFHTHSTVSTTSACYGVHEVYAERSGVNYKYIAYQTGNNLEFLRDVGTVAATSGINWGPQYFDCCKAGEIFFSPVDLSAGPVGEGLKFYVDAVGTIQVAPIGLPPPTIPTPALSGTTGSWSVLSTITYRITWIVSNGYEFVEGNCSPGGGIVLDTQTRICTITRPAVPSGYNITSWRIYRRVNSIETIETFLATVAAGTATFVDTGNNFMITANNEAPYEKSQIPESPEILGYHGDRIWAGCQSGRVYYSRVNSPAGSCQNFSTAKMFTVGSGDEDFIKFISFPNFLLVVKRHSMWTIEGNDMSDFRLQKIMTMGSCSPQMTVFYNNYLYFVNELGIWRTTLFDEPENLATSIWNDFIDIRPNIESDETYKWQAIFDPKSQCLWFNFKGVCILLYNPAVGRWAGKYSINSLTSMFVLRQWSSVSAFGFANNGGAGANKFYYDTDDIYIFGGLTPIHEAAFDVYAKTGMMVPDETLLHKRLFRIIQLFTNLAKESYTTNSTEVVTIKTAVSENVTFTASMTASFGGGLNGSFITKNLSRSGKGISFYFEKLACAGDLMWEVGPVKLEYENIGNW